VENVENVENPKASADKVLQACCNQSYDRNFQPLAAPFAVKSPSCPLARWIGETDASRSG
jgi:hypothetical protein